MIKIAKPKYYSIESIWKTDSDYHILLGERANGKSYSAKNKAITRAYNSTDQKFIYMRRYDSDVKSSLVERYFADVPIEAISNGKADSIMYYRGQIWAAKTDPSTLKQTRIKHLGYAIPLNLESRFKSGSYLDVDFILFEEFVSNEGYLPDEVRKFKSFVSTIARNRKIKVVLIGNTISRICPYYTAWELYNIPKQEQGTIDFYYQKYFDTESNTEQIVKIAVEFCARSGMTGKMFFGESDSMIMTGAWETPKVPFVSPHTGTIYYTIVVTAMNFKFLAEFKVCENGFAFWYITPKTTAIKPNTRVVTDKEVFNPYYTKGFRPLNKAESIMFKCFVDDRVFYSSPLCAADFRNIMKNIRRTF